MRSCLRSPLAILIVAVYAAPVSVFAQPVSADLAPTSTLIVPAGARLSLAQAWSLALENDATLRAAKAASQARSERLPQARAQMRPSVSASLGRFRNDLENTAPGLGGLPATVDRNYTSSSRTLTVRQPLFRPLQWADIRQARAQVEEAQATLEREVQNLAVRLTTAYLQALASQDQVVLVSAQKAAYAIQLDAARKRFAGGAGVRTDVDEAQARVDLALAQELEARQNLDYTRQQLQTLINQPVSNIAPLDERRLPLHVPIPEGVEAWIANAEQSSPEIRALNSQREAARSEIDKAKAGHLPTLDAVGQWAVNQSESVTTVNNRTNQKSIGLQLTVPIYSGGFISSQVRQALSVLEQVEQTLEATRRDLGLRVHREYRGVTEGVLRVRALEQAVRSSQQVVTSTERSFQGGVRTLVDILNAKEQLASAQRELSEARYTYLLSRIRLKALAGYADEETIKEADSWLSY